MGSGTPRARPRRPAASMPAAGAKPPPAPSRRGGGPGAAGGRAASSGWARCPPPSGGRPRAGPAARRGWWRRAPPPSRPGPRRFPASPPLSAPGQGFSAAVGGRGAGPLAVPARRAPGSLAELSNLVNESSQPPVLFCSLSFLLPGSIVTPCLEPQRQRQCTERDVRVRYRLRRRQQNRTSPGVTACARPAPDNRA